jgi:predicted phosphatase
MKAILDANNVPYDEILPPTPDLVVFIDDKGIRFREWLRVLGEVRS